MMAIMLMLVVDEVSSWRQSGRALISWCLDACAGPAQPVQACCTNLGLTAVYEKKNMLTEQKT
jgi:hypothetical protein